MRNLQVILVFILAAHQSYQHHIPTLRHDQLEVASISEVDESLKPGIYRLGLDRSENPSYKFNHEITHGSQEIHWNRVQLPPSRAQIPESMLAEEEMHYPDLQQEDKKRSFSVRSEDKRRSVSVKSKAIDEDYDNQLMDKKRSVSYGDEDHSAHKRNLYAQYQQYFGKQHEHNDDQEEDRHVKTRSLVPSLPTENLENTLLKKMTEKLLEHQSVSVTLREIHQIVREAQKQVWDQVVKMFPGGELAQAMLRAQKEKLFAGLAFNPFKQNVKGTNVDNGLPGANTIFPVPHIPGPWGKLIQPKQPSPNTEAKQDLFNPLGFFGSKN